MSAPQVAEDGGSFVVTLGISGRTELVNVTGTLSTLGKTAQPSMTAVEDTNFIALSGTARDWSLGGRQFTFPSGENTDITVSIPLIDNNEKFNKIFQTQIDDGSLTAGAVVGSTQAILCKVLATNNTSTVPQQEAQYRFDTTADVSGNEITIATHPFGVADPVFYGMGGGSYALGPTDNALVYVHVIDVDTLTLHPTAGDATSNTNAIVLTSGGGETHALYTNTYGDQILVCAADNYASITQSSTGVTWEEVANPGGTTRYAKTNVLSPNAGSTSGYNDTLQNAPLISYDLNFTSTGTYGAAIRFRGTIGSTADTLNGGFNGVLYHPGARFQLTGSWEGTAPNSLYHQSILTKSISFTVPTAGIHSFNVGVRETKSDVYVDGIVVAPSGYDFSADNEILSRFVSSAVAADDPANPTIIVPPSSGSVLAPTRTYPVNEATNIPVSVKLFAYWADATSLTITASTVTDVGGKAIDHNVGPPFIGVGIYGAGAYAGPTMTAPLSSAATGVTPYTWTMTGSVVDSNGVTKNVYVSAIFTTIDRVSYPLYVNFNNRSLGKYSEADCRTDFNINTNGYNDTVHGPEVGWESMDVVADPSENGARRNVLRVFHEANRAGASIGSSGLGSGLRFRADVPPANEYYFAYDFYLPIGWIQPLQLKMPALINGTLLEASHATEVTPTPETLVAFNGRIQSFSDAAYARGNRSLAAVVYDKDSVQQPKWFNSIDPTSENKVGQYILPIGQWVRIEEYMKVNTDGLKNGALKVWMDGKLVYDKPHRWRDAASTRLIDGVFMYSFYGGNVSDSRNKIPQDQYQYYDNFIISTSPITH